MTIDANELREAIHYLRAIAASEFAERGTHRIAAERVIAGAEFGLTALPKKLDEVEAWAVVTPCGTVRSVWIEEFWAKDHAASPSFTPPALVVRLSGLVTLPPRGKD